MKNYLVYILASQPRGTLYVGTTNDLIRRVYARSVEPEFFDANGSKVWVCREKNYANSIFSSWRPLKMVTN